MKSIQSIRRGERLTILILIVFFLGMGVLVWKVVKESSFYMSHSDDVTLGMVYDRNNQILFDPNASTETYDENYFLDVGNVIGDDSGQMTNTLVSENIEKLQNYSLIFGATPHGKTAIYSTLDHKANQTVYNAFGSKNGTAPIGVTAPIPVMTNFCSFMLVPLLTEIYAKACPIVIRQIYNMRYLIAL